METINILHRVYEEAFQYGDMTMDGKFRRKDERHALARNHGLYLLCDEITITMEDLSRAVSIS